MDVTAIGLSDSMSVPASDPAVFLLGSLIFSVSPLFSVRMMGVPAGTGLGLPPVFWNTCVAVTVTVVPSSEATMSIWSKALL